MMPRLGWRARWIRKKNAACYCGWRIFLKCLRVLWQGECCVNELAEAIDMEASAVSHQLRILRQAHLVDFRRIGKNACYFLDDAHVVHLLEQGLNHAAHRGEE